MSSGYDKLGERVEEEAGRLADSPARYGRRLLKWALVVVAVLTVSLGLLGTGLGWFGKGRDLVSPEHSEAQVTAVLDDWTSMEATAGNACQARGQVGGGDPTLVERPEFAYAAQYRRIKADYDRRMRNLFEAAVTRNLPLPAALGDYPRSAPTLREMQGRVC